MGRSNRSNDVRTARRVKATLNAKSAAEFERFLNASQSPAETVDTATAYLANRALTKGSQRA